MNDKFRYTKQSIDPSILSVLDIAADGKVISAQDWTELWSLVIKRINNIDTFNVEVNKFCVAWDDTISNLTAVIEDFNKKYNSFKNGYVHYGADEPTDPNTLFWVEPVSDADDKLFATRGDLTNKRIVGGGVVAGNIPTNTAYAKHTYAGGSENVAGCLGFKIINIGTYENQLVGQLAGDASVLAAYTSDNNICIQWGQVFDYSANAVYIDHTPGTAYTVFRLDKIPDGFNLNDADEGHLWVPAAPNIGNVVLGENAYAEGVKNKAVQYVSHAEGYNNIAASKYAHVEGKDNVAGWASHAEGANNKALGLCSHTEGSKNIASRNNTHAEGTNTKALFDNAHAEGNGTTAGTATNGHAAHAEGKKSQATGDVSHAEGNETQATAEFSHSEGDKSVASGIGSHAENNGKASGRYSHAEGNSTASGEKSHAEGNGSQAKGQASHSEGDSTNAGGKCAHSQGCWTFADGENSTAAGWMSIAKSKNSVASGTYCIAKAEGQHAVGRYNEEVTNALFVVGNGTAQNARSNALVVLENGSIVLKGATGYKTFTPAMIDKLYNLLSE